MRVRAALVLALCTSFYPLAANGFPATGASGQESTGSIRGTVVNTVGSALPGVAVEVTSASGAVGLAITDRKGVFIVDGLAPGLYSVSATEAAVKRAAVEHVRVNAGRAAIVDFTLAPEAATETSQVSYLPGRVAGSVDDSTIFPADLIDRLPKGRDALSLVPMAPGISVDTPYTGLSFRGASAAENRYLIDGFDVTNMYAGGIAFSVPIDVVQQLTVRSGGVEPVSPTATGAVVSIVTPFAGRRWRGTGALHFTNDALTSQAQAGDASFSTWEPAITAGGPLFGNWLSLFASYTPRFSSATRTMPVVNAQGATASGSFASADRTQLSTDNLTGRLGATGRFRISAIIGRIRREGALPPVSESPLPAGFDWSALARSQPIGALSGTFDTTLPSGFMVSLQGGYSRTDVLDDGVPQIVYRTANAPGPSTPPEVAAALTAVRATSAPIPTNAAIDRDVQQLITGRFAVGSRFTALGAHEMRGGAQVDYTMNEVLAGSFGPVVVINATRGSSPYGTYDVSSWLLSGDANATRYAIFLDDTWRVSSRLTVRAGVRSERQTIPPYATTVPDPASPGKTIPLSSVTLDFLDTVSPRLGAAFDVRGDGSWIASGTWGIAHDPVKLDLARYYLGADVRYRGTYTLDTLDFSTIGYVGCLNPKDCKIMFPGTPLSSSFAAPLRSIGTSLKATAEQDFSVGLDHAMASSATIGVRYVRRRLARALEDVGYFATTGATTPALQLVTIGEAPVSLGTGLPDAPPPRRDYDAMEATFSKRFAHGWHMAAAYTFSRLTGNYTAFFTPGTPDAPPQYPPLWEDAWAYTTPYNSPLSLFDSHGAAVYGPLDLDRPHVVKLQVLAMLPLELSAGVYQVVASGAPISRWVSIGAQPVYYEGRLTDGRTPTYSQTDVLVQREFKLASRLRLLAALNVLNLFDQQATVAVDGFEGTLPAMAPSQFFAGFDPHQLMTSTNPSFLQPAVLQPGRAIRVDLRVTF